MQRKYKRNSYSLENVTREASRKRTEPRVLRGLQRILITTNANQREERHEASIGLHQHNRKMQIYYRPTRTDTSASSFSAPVSTASPVIKL